MDCSHHCDSHTCQISAVCQSLDELEFERGIWSAAQSGELSKVEKLVGGGTAVDCRDASGYTALHYAARNGHLKVCEYLIRRKACVNAVTKAGGASALHRAALAGKVDVVKLLLKNGADCRLKDGDNKSALHRAAEAQNYEICEAIVTVAPDLVFEEDCRGNVPGYYAKSEELTRLLKVK